MRWPLAAGALALGAVSFLASGGTEAPLGPRELAVLCQGAGTRVLQGNQFTPLGVTSWVLAVALGLAACWQRPHRAAGRPAHRGARLGGPFPAPRVSTRPALRLSWTAIALGAVILCGTGVLFCRLDQVPAEMTSDHAEKLLDARDVLDGAAPHLLPLQHRAGGAAVLPHRRHDPPHRDSPT